MQIFLTGEQRIGKTSIIEKFLKHTGLKAGGFRTCWRPSANGGGDLLLLPYSMTPETCSEANRIAHRNGLTLETFPEPFSQLGPELLADATGQTDYYHGRAWFYRKPGQLTSRLPFLRCLDGKIPVPRCDPGA